MLDVSRLQAGYGRARVVHDFSLSVGPGEVLGLVGRNGVGKTTSLKAILGLVDVFGGTVSVRGHVAGPMSPVSACRLGIGYPLLLGLVFIAIVLWAPKGLVSLMPASIRRTPGGSE